jgi:hypothetical protein
VLNPLGASVVVVVVVGGIVVVVVVVILGVKLTFTQPAEFNDVKV